MFLMFSRLFSRVFSRVFLGDFFKRLKPCYLKPFGKCFFLGLFNNSQEKLQDWMLCLLHAIVLLE